LQLDAYASFSILSVSLALIANRLALLRISLAIPQTQTRCPLMFFFHVHTSLTLRIQMKMKAIEHSQHAGQASKRLRKTNGCCASFRFSTVFMTKICWRRNAASAMAALLAAFSGARDEGIVRALRFSETDSAIWLAVGDPKHVFVFFFAVNVEHFAFESIRRNKILDTVERGGADVGVDEVIRNRCRAEGRQMDCLLLTNTREDGT